MPPIRRSTRATRRRNGGSSSPSRSATASRSRQRKTASGRGGDRRRGTGRCIVSVATSSSWTNSAGCSSSGCSWWSCCSWSSSTRAASRRRWRSARQAGEPQVRARRRASSAPHRQRRVRLGSGRAHSGVSASRMASRRDQPSASNSSRAGGDALQISSGPWHPKRGRPSSTTSRRNGRSLGSLRPHQLHSCAWSLHGAGGGSGRGRGQERRSREEQRQRVARGDQEHRRHECVRGRCRAQGGPDRGGDGRRGDGGRSIRCPAARRGGRAASGPCDPDEQDHPSVTCVPTCG